MYEIQFSMKITNNYIININDKYLNLLGHYLHMLHRHDMAEILQTRRKTPINQSFAANC